MSDWVNYFERADRSIFHEVLRNRRLIELVMQEAPAKGKILEAGCGTAVLSLLLADCGYDVTAMDLTEEVLHFARKRCSLNGIKLSFVRGDIFRLSEKFDENQFDVICHSGVLEHFSDEQIVTSLIEHRKVGRKIVFNVPNHRSRITAASFGDERLMDNKKWLELIHAAGFSRAKVYGGYDLIRIPYFFLPGVFFNHRLAFWWKWFSRHSIFLCE